MKYEADFNSWRKLDHHCQEHFITDGIVNEVGWDQAKPRILFLNKEAYGDINDVRHELLENGAYKNWSRVLIWAYAITYIWENNSIPEFPDQGTFDWSGWLQKIALVNVKKSAGKKLSQERDLLRYAELDKLLLRNQIDIINPEVIVCGYTYDWPLYQTIYDLKKDELAGGSISDLCIPHVVKGQNRVIIDYWHFANRYPTKMAFYALSAIFLKHRLRVTSK